MSIQVFVVGVGSGVDKTELNAIATDPDSSHVLTVQNFQQLSQLSASLNSQACKGAPFFSIYLKILLESCLIKAFNSYLICDLIRINKGVFQGELTLTSATSYI